MTHRFILLLAAALGIFAFAILSLEPSHVIITGDDIEPVRFEARPPPVPSFTGIPSTGQWIMVTSPAGACSIDGMSVNGPVICGTTVTWR